jgi:hypothetical protein
MGLFSRIFQSGAIIVPSEKAPVVRVLEALPKVYFETENPSPEFTQLMNDLVYYSQVGEWPKREVK